MDHRIKKFLFFIVLAGLLPLARAVLPLDEWVASLGNTIGEASFGTDLTSYLLGFSEPSTGPWFPQSFTWCYYVPLLTMTLYYYVLDRPGLRDAGTWLLFVGAAALVVAVWAYVIVARNDGVVPLLEEVGVGARLVWALLNFLFAALLGTLFSLALAPAAVSTRLTPFGR